jgi:hypothetical protein
VEDGVINDNGGIGGKLFIILFKDDFPTARLAQRLERERIILNYELRKILKNSHGLF